MYVPVGIVTPSINVAAAGGGGTKKYGAVVPTPYVSVSCANTYAKSGAVTPATPTVVLYAPAVLLTLTIRTQ